MRRAQLPEVPRECPEKDRMGGRSSRQGRSTPPARRIRPRDAPGGRIRRASQDVPAHAVDARMGLEARAGRARGGWRARRAWAMLLSGAPPPDPDLPDPRATVHAKLHHEVDVMKSLSAFPALLLAVAVLAGCSNESNPVADLGGSDPAQAYASAARSEE